VPPEKLVLGVPFYGKSWIQVPDQNPGLYQPGKEAPNTYLPYSALTSLQNSGYTRYWDSNASAPYLYNRDIQTFISYDDPESLKKKCEYVVDHKLAGVMFWEYTGDSANTLLDAIDVSLRRDTTTTTETR